MKKPMTTEEYFNLICGILRGKGLIPEDILDYGLATHEPVPMRTYEFDVRNHLNYGASEGIYLDLAIEYYEDGKRQLKELGTFKTLQRSSEAMRTMYHEIFSMEAHEVIGSNGYLDIQDLLMIGDECSRIYFEEGHQVIFVIHRNGTGYHIHFAVNSVSFVDGHKFRTNRVNRWERELIFNEILQKHRGQCHGTLREVEVQGDNPPSAEDVGEII